MASPVLLYLLAFPMKSLYNITLRLSTSRDRFVSGMPSSFSLQATNITGWTLLGIGIALTIVRLWLRAFVIRKTYWDDLFHVFALLLFVGEMVDFQFYSASIVDVDGTSNKQPSDPKYAQFQARDLTMTILSFTCFWATKFAFLTFYHLLFKRQNGFKRAWWVVLALTFLTYWAVIGGTLAECDGVAANFLKITACTTPSAISYQKKRFIFNYVLNIGTDLAIMALPLSCLRQLQLSLRRKVGLGIIFTFAFIIIAFESLRLAESIGGIGSSNNAMWLFLESAACVYVSCFPTFASLRIWMRNGYRVKGYHVRQELVRTQPTATMASSVHSTAVGSRGVEGKDEVEQVVV